MSQPTSLPAPPELDPAQRRHLAALSLQPGWPILRGVAKRAMEERFAKLARNLMQPGKTEADIKPSLEYQRGFFAGMKHLLDNPEMESEKLDREFEQRKVSEVDA